MPDIMLTPFVPASTGVPPYGTAIGLEVGNVNELLEKLSNGLPSESFAKLQGLLGLSQRELASYLGLAEATLHRRLSEGHLKSEESERLYRYLEVFEKAVELFEDDDKARAWLKKPALALGGKTPLEFAKSERGAREVLAVIDRLEYGVLG